MTAAQIVTKFTNMVDDVLDTDYTYQLLNDAMNEVESMAVWEILKRSTSFTGTSTSLPTRFQRVLTIVDSSGYVDYKQIPFEQKDMYISTGFTFYINYSDSTINILQNNGVTKNVYYSIYSADLTSGDTWGFPAWCHSILAYKMAEIYYASDAGEKSRSWDDRWSAQYERMLNRMFQWNDSLKVAQRRTRAVNDNPKAINYT